LLDLGQMLVAENMHWRSPGDSGTGRLAPPDPACAIVETAGGAAIRTRSRMCFVPFVQRGRKLADQPTMLYDLDADPYQFRNLAGEEGTMDEERRLASAVREWDARTPWME